MPIPDETIIAAMADAAEGKGVLVITPLASETDAIVSRAKLMTVENLVRNAGVTTHEAQSFILASPNPWQVRLKSRGWVFFFPEPDLKPNDDVGNPSYVYASNKRGQYEKVPYLRWRTTQVIPTVQEITPKADAEPKSAWSRLMETEDD
jgi:hypothetical protein